MTLKAGYGLEPEKHSPMPARFIFPSETDTEAEPCLNSQKARPSSCFS